jgi:tetratricopeptide (TPR) repeat protein
MMQGALTVVMVLVCHLFSIDPGYAQERKALRMITLRNRQEAQTIRQQLQQGASFSALAGMKSLGPERNTWGYSGIVRLEEVQRELRPVLQRLKYGQISDVLSLGQAFVIVKVISPEIERHFAAADRAMDEGKTAQAIQELKAALSLEEDNVQAYLTLGLAYDRAAQYEEAISYLEKAQQYAPQSVQIAVSRGAVYTDAAIKRKDLAYAQKALQVYEQTLRLHAQLAPSMHFGLGKVYLLALQQPETALTHLEQAVSLTPRVPEVYRLLIQAYYDTRRYEKAWQYLRFAQGLGYDFPELREALHKVAPQAQR